MFDWSKDTLPIPTADLDIARANIDEFGYRLLEEAIPAEQLVAARERLLAQAAAELQAGLAFEDGGPNSNGGRSLMKQVG